MFDQIADNIFDVNELYINQLITGEIELNNINEPLESEN